MDYSTVFFRLSAEKWFHEVPHAITFEDFEVIEHEELGGAAAAAARVASPDASSESTISDEFASHYLTYLEHEGSPVLQIHELTQEVKKALESTRKKVLDQTESLAELLGVLQGFKNEASHTSQDLRSRQIDDRIRVITEAFPAFSYNEIKVLYEIQDELIGKLTRRNILLKGGEGEFTLNKEVPLKKAAEKFLEVLKKLTTQQYRLYANPVQVVNDSICQEKVRHLETLLERITSLSLSQRDFYLERRDNPETYQAFLLFVHDNPDFDVTAFDFEQFCLLKQLKSEGVFSAYSDDELLLLMHFGEASYAAFFELIHDADKTDEEKWNIIIKSLLKHLFRQFNKAPEGSLNLEIPDFLEEIKSQPLPEIRSIQESLEPKVKGILDDPKFGAIDDTERYPILLGNFLTTGQSGLEGARDGPKMEKKDAYLLCMHYMQRRLQETIGHHEHLISQVNHLKNAYFPGKSLEDILNDPTKTFNPSMLAIKDCLRSCHEMLKIAEKDIIFLSSQLEFLKTLDPTEDNSDDVEEFKRSFEEFFIRNPEEKHPFDIVGQLDPSVLNAREHSYKGIDFSEEVFNQMKGAIEAYHLISHQFSRLSEIFSGVYETLSPGSLEV